MRKILSLAVLFFVYSSCLFAQKNCGSELDVEELKKSNPKGYEQMIQFNKFVEQHIPNENERIVDPNGTIIIPVVFHVLHDGQPQPFLNPNDARVKSQIDVLNEDFRRLNADRVNTPSVFQSVAADVNIEFRLACIDPNGNPTTGITRRNVGNKTFVRIVGNEFATGIKFTSQGGQDAWPTDKYLNIWVCSRLEVIDKGLNIPLLGYGTFAFLYPQNITTDGVVVTATALGTGFGTTNQYE